MKKNILFALIVLSIIIVLSGCKGDRCSYSAYNKLQFEGFDSLESNSLCILNSYEIGNLTTGSFTKLTKSDTLKGMPNGTDLDYSHDYEVLIPTFQYTFQICQIKYVEKYMTWPGGGTVSEVCSDMMSYAVNGKHKEDHFVMIRKQ